MSGVFVIITTKSRKIFIQGTATVDCDADDVESTTAELYGQLAVHTILTPLANMFG